MFAGGGTAGHINPALSIANYFRERDNAFQALFIGTERGLETKLVPREGYEIRYIDIRGFDRRRLWRNVAVLYKLAAARRACREIMEEFKPDAVVCTGGYVSGPVAMAAGKLHLPAIIHEQNVYPGLTVKGAEKYVNYVVTSFEETKNYMKHPEKCVLAGNPLRPEILKTDRAEARKKLGLGKEPFVLVFGGSLGAEKINETMAGVLQKIKPGAMRLLFGTGDRNYDRTKARLAQAGVDLGGGIQVVPYINNMETVMPAADLIVSRAGAITVSEIAALGKPSILIPSPNVVRNHQEQNARAFEAKGAAVILTEDRLTADTLFEAMMKLVSDPQALEKMGRNVKKIAKTDALEQIYKLILGIVKQ